MQLAFKKHHIYIIKCQVCVAARYVQSLVLGAYTNQQDPSNDYVLITAKTGWKYVKTNNDFVV